MIIGGEVDAVMDVKPDDKSLPVNWVELKTTAAVVNEREQIKFERKLLKFWAQSFLLGVPKIIVGYRTPQGILERVEELDTQTIPDKVRLNGKGLWDGQICINFASSFLECKWPSHLNRFMADRRRAEKRCHRRRCLADSKAGKGSHYRGLQA